MMLLGRTSALHNCKGAMQFIVSEITLPAVVQCTAYTAIHSMPAQLSEPEALDINAPWAIFSKVLKGRPFKQIYENLGQTSSGHRTTILISTWLSMATQKTVYLPWFPFLPVILLLVAPSSGLQNSLSIRAMYHIPLLQNRNPSYGKGSVTWT